MDYLKFYELSREPFQNDPDGHFFFEGSIHRRARLLLMRGVMQRKALSVLVGEAGCGKTTLAQHIFSGLDHGVFSARMLVISHAECANGWLLPHIARAFGIKQVAPDPPSQLEQIQAALVRHLENDHYPLLFVDEAQLLSNAAVMEEFRGLLNLAHGGSRILSVVLFGLPDLSDILKLDKPLAQRVEVRADVSGLPPDEVAAYALHRLAKAGAQQELFTEEALGALHTYSGGVPRLINTLADNVLFEGFMSETRPVDLSMVASVAEQLELGPKSVSGAGGAPAGDAVPPVPEPPGATPQPIGESTAAELDRLALEARTETPTDDSESDFSMGSIVRESTGAPESHPDSVTVVPGYDVNLPSKREEPNLHEVAPELEIFDGSAEPPTPDASDEIEAIALDGLTLTEDSPEVAAAHVKGEDSLALGESFSDEPEATSEQSEGDRGIDLEQSDSASGEQTIVASIEALGDLEAPGAPEAVLEDDDEGALDEAFDLGDAIQTDDDGALGVNGVADAALELDGDVEESGPRAGESASGSEDLPEVKRAPSAAPVQDEDTFDPGELLLDDDLEEADGDAAESAGDAAEADPEEDLDELFENIQLDN